MGISDKVQVSSSQAEAANNKLKKSYSELEKMMNDLDRQVKDMTKWWGGATTEEFISSYGKATVAFKENLKRLEAHGKNMVTAVKRQQEQDQAMAKIVKRY